VVERSHIGSSISGRLTIGYRMATDVSAISASGCEAVWEGLLISDLMMLTQEEGRRGI